MIILFDLIAMQPNADGKYHGGGKYAKVVFLKIIERLKFKNDFELYLLIDKMKFIEKDVQEIIDIDLINVLDINKLPIEIIIEKYNIDRFYSALPYNFKNINKINCDIIGAIHGLRGLEITLNWHSLKYDKNKNLFKNLLKIVFKKIFYKRTYTSFEKLLELKNIKV